MVPLTVLSGSRPSAAEPGPEKPSAIKGLRAAFPAFFFGSAVRRAADLLCRQRYIVSFMPLTPGETLTRVVDRTTNVAQTATIREAMLASIHLVRERIAVVIRVETSLLDIVTRRKGCRYVVAGPYA